VLVSIPQQKAYVFEDGELLATSPVSTGKRGHETPAGTFRILQKKVHHRSNKYANAPMPYMQRLTNYGIALHAGKLPGYPASHGCIRLPWGFAKKLYGLTDHSTRVTVTHQRPKSAEHALNLV
jgi:lipoprotein-anchoring transpeptidase ErfK/SrfK